MLARVLPIVSLVLGATATAAEPVPVPLPAGSAVEIEPRPASAGAPYCAPHRPVCVHPGRQDAATALAALAALVDAYERLVLALGLPSPLADHARGGSDALDAYLVGPGDPVRVHADPPESGLFSRAPGFCRLPVGDPALLRRSASLCLGEAVALSLDASEPPHLRRAFATFLWWVSGEPTALDVEAVDRVQRSPELAIAEPELGPRSEGAALFFEYLDRALGAAGPAELAASLFAAAASPRPAGSEYDNEPDVFDVLRHTLDSNRTRFARLLGDFAAARAFVGSRDDGRHLPALGWAGEFGRVRFDWVLELSSLPRRVAIQPPVSSTGAALVWLDVGAVPDKTSLGFRAEWEPPVSFHWQLIRLGPDGEELGRLVVPWEERATSAEAVLGHLGGVAAVLAVGTNLEWVELSHPFDPDVAPFEPHGVSVYFAKL